MKCTIAVLKKEQIPQLCNCLLEFFPRMNHAHLEKLLFPELPLTEYSNTGVFPGTVLLSEDGAVHGFTASFAAELFLQQTPLPASFWGMTYVKDAVREYSVDLFMHLCSDSNVLVYYSNTSNANGEKGNRAMHHHIGPSSCHGIRFAILDLAVFIAFCASRIPVLKTLPSSLWSWLTKPAGWLYSLRDFARRPSGSCHELTVIDDVLFAKFNAALIAANTGLLSSRAPGVLHWVYDQGLQDQKIMLFGAFESNQLRGYIAIRRFGAWGRHSRYSILDWVAIGNDQKVLNDLLATALWTAKKRHGYALELAGYPLFIEKELSHYMPFFRKTASNFAMWNASSRAVNKQIASVIDHSWFFGPFDGDRKVCSYE